MSALDDLVELLDLESVDDTHFRSRGRHTDHPRMYGGQLLAQAVMAAGRAVGDDRTVHSMHASFLQGGDATAPVDYEVAILRDGGTFTTSRVTATQGARSLLHAMTSFHVAEDGPEHDLPTSPAIGPEDAAPIDDWTLAQPTAEERQGSPYFLDAVEFRQDPATFRPSVGTQHGEVFAPTRDVWMRARGSLRDDPLLHAGVIAYASDKPLLGTAVLSAPLHGEIRRHHVASLDHSIWFHRSFRADEWLRYHLESTVASRARAFTRGEIHRADGALVASATQEGLVRPVRADA